MIWLASKSIEQIDGQFMFGFSNFPLLGPSHNSFYILPFKSSDNLILWRRNIDWMQSIEFNSRMFVLCNSHLFDLQVLPISKCVFTSQSCTFVNEFDHLIVEYLIDFWLNLKVVAIQYSNQEPVIWIWLT